MKILKYLLILIVLAASVFFGRGMMTPSVSYGSEITVNKSAAESWAVMSDESNLPNWIEGYIRSELVSGTANTAGAISKVYVDNNGEEMAMEETIVESIPNKKLAMTFAMGPMDMDYVMTFDEKDGKTSIRSESTTKGSGIFMKSLLSFMKGGMQKQEDKNLGNLKKIIDENTKVYN